MLLLFLLPLLLLPSCCCYSATGVAADASTTSTTTTIPTKLYSIKKMTVIWVTELTVVQMRMKLYNTEYTHCFVAHCSMVSPGNLFCYALHAWVRFVLKSKISNQQRLKPPEDDGCQPTVMSDKVPINIIVQCANTWDQSRKKNSCEHTHSHARAHFLLP